MTIAIDAGLLTQVVTIPTDEVLTGDLTIPASATGIVVFVHGSGNSRSSPRNQHVAALFQAHGLATLLLDLLTPEEEALDALTGQLHFDLPLLADRLAKVTGWLGAHRSTHSLHICYFGASTGAAAALMAAARVPGRVHAIVSRGGRPDLAGPYLRRVKAPTLLIVGGKDVPVLGLNQWAFRQLTMPVRKLAIVPGATHLFEEPGTLDRVADLALTWFAQQLQSETRLPIETEAEIC